MPGYFFPTFVQLTVRFCKLSVDEHPAADRLRFGRLDRDICGVTTMAPSIYHNATSVAASNVAEEAGPWVVSCVTKTGRRPPKDIVKGNALNMQPGKTDADLSQRGRNGVDTEGLDR